MIDDLVINRPVAGKDRVGRLCDATGHGQSAHRSAVVENAAGGMAKLRVQSRANKSDMVIIAVQGDQLRTLTRDVPPDPSHLVGVI